RGFSRIPSTGFRRRLRTELEDALDLFEERGWLDDPVSYHVPPEPLTRPEIERRESWGRTFEHLVAPSTYEPHPGEPGGDRWRGYRRNRHLHAWLLRHDDRARPWLVGVNGYRTGQPLIDIGAFRAMHLHHRLGLNVALAVSPLHGPRRLGRSGDRVLNAGAMNMIHTVAQATSDVRSLIAWLRAEQGASVVGLTGLSLGGNISAVVAGLEPELACVILGIPETDLVRGMRRQIEPLLPPFYEMWGLSFGSIERVTRVVSPLRFAPRVAPERRAIYAGLVDRWVRPGNVRALWDHWGRPPICWYDGGHLSGLRDPRVTDFVDDTLRRTLLGSTPRVRGGSPPDL
ncbi:MAG: alpha/beta hydrolase family protein, partial [Acidimicrobiales bacterium]